jgi:hypothetical protein
MAEAFDPFKIETSKKESKPGVINDINEAYSGAEGNNEISSLESALAGIASGIVSLSGISTYNSSVESGASAVASFAFSSSSSSTPFSSITFSM